MLAPTVTPKIVGTSLERGEKVAAAAQPRSATRKRYGSFLMRFAFLGLGKLVPATSV